MIQPTHVIRIARPTDNLLNISQMYLDGLGFSLLGEFENHEGFDGVIIGHPKHNYHLEFTHQRNHSVGKAPSQDNLLVFYIEDKAAWTHACENLTSAGFLPVRAYNPYWDVCGKTFEDLDGYRVVLQNSLWAE